MDEGGAVYCSSNLIMDNATFVNNNAKKGGAVYFSNGTVTGSNFTGNHASSAGAISTSGDLTVENTVFKDNSATDGSDNVVLIGDAKLTLINVTPKDLIPSHIEVIEIVDVQNASYGGTVKITVNVTGVDGTTPLSNCTVAVVIDGKTYSAKISNGTATIAISGLNAGSYDANVTLITEGYAALSKQVKFQISKINAKITASAKSYVINYGGKYSITLKDINGKLLSGLKVVFTLNGKSLGSATTNSKGVATITLTAKALKTAKVGKRNLVVKFGGNVNYNQVSTSVKIKINKEKPK